MSDLVVQYTNWFTKQYEHVVCSWYALLHNLDGFKRLEFDQILCVLVYMCVCIYMYSVFLLNKSVDMCVYLAFANGNKYDMLCLC